MKHAIYLLAIVVLIQEEKPWRIYVEKKGGPQSWREDGKDGRAEPPELNFRGNLSPDGKWEAQLREVGQDEELWISNRDGSNKRRILEKQELLGEPAWLPDSRRLMYVSSISGRRQVWVVNTDGSAPTRLTDHADGVRSPAVSPKGDLIAYFEEHSSREKLPPSTLRTMKLDGTDSKALKERAQMLGCTWSPAGDRLAVSLVGKLEIVEPSTGKPVHEFEFIGINRQLGSHGAYGLVWRPDGGAIACTIQFLGGRMLGAKIYGDHQVFILPLKGAPVTIEFNEPAAPVRWIR